MPTAASSCSASFVVNVTPVNQQPTLNPYRVSPTANENILTAQIGDCHSHRDLAGLGDTGQIVTLTAVSNNTAPIPNPSISYTNGNPTATATSDGQHQRLGRDHRHRLG